MIMFIPLTPDGLCVICVDNDPEKIGIHMLEMLDKSIATKVELRDSVLITVIIDYNPHTAKSLKVCLKDLLIERSCGRHVNRNLRMPTPGIIRKLPSSHERKHVII